MAGGDGSPRRSTADSVEAAATGPPQGSLTRSSTKRKARKEEAASSGQVLRPRSTARKAKKDATARAAAAAEKAAAARNRMPAKEVQRVLALKPGLPSARYQAVKRSNPELTPRPGEEQDEEKMRLYKLTRAFYEWEENLPRMQERMRRELETKGYVEVDDEYHRNKARAKAIMDREWPKIQAQVDAIRLKNGCGESESDSSEESDSEEEEEEEDE